MFNELLESVARRRDKRKRWALIFSATFQTASLMILIIIPLIYTQALPKAFFGTVIVALPERTAKAPEQTAPRSAVRAVRLLNHGILIEPPRIPKNVNVIAEPPLPPESPSIEGPTSSDSGMDLLSVAAAPVDRVSRPAAPPNVPQRVPVTSTIEAAKLISRVQPIYPPLAIQARIQGNVILHAIISKEGEVSELQVLSGHPLLVNAALTAVRQWRYSPTLLNGQSVEVETSVTVSFVLGQ